MLQITKKLDAIEASRLYVGWRTEVVRPELLPKLKAPSNYKDPAAIAEYIRKEEVKRETQAVQYPGAHVLSQIVVYDAFGSGPVFMASGVEDTAREFYKFLCDNIASARYRNIRSQHFPAWLRVARSSLFTNFLCADLLSDPDSANTQSQDDELKYAKLAAVASDEDSFRVSMVSNPLRLLPFQTTNPVELQVILNNTWFRQFDTPLQFGTPSADALALYYICEKLQV